MESSPRSDPTTILLLFNICMHLMLAAVGWSTGNWQSSSNSPPAIWNRNTRFDWPTAIMSPWTEALTHWLWPLNILEHTSCPVCGVRIICTVCTYSFDIWGQSITLSSITWEPICARTCLCTLGLYVQSKSWCTYSSYAFSTCMSVLVLGSRLFTWNDSLIEQAAISTLVVRAFTNWPKHRFWEGKTRILTKSPFRLFHRDMVRLLSMFLVIWCAASSVESFEPNVWERFQSAGSDCRSRSFVVRPGWFGGPDVLVDPMPLDVDAYTNDPSWRRWPSMSRKYFFFSWS